MKVGDLVRFRRLVDSPFRPSEWNKVFLIVGDDHPSVFYIWRNNREFPINAKWLEVVSESR